MIIRKLRKLGGILRGNVTPYQITAACILGSLLGFMPGEGWALSAVLVLLVVIVSANLFLFGLVAILAKLLSLVLLPVTFAAGRFLLDGPVSGLFAAMINAPVLAFFGFEYYLVSGALLTGLVIGIILSVLINKGLKSYWRRMSHLQQGSERYNRWTGKWWVRAVSWIFLGPAKKDSYEDTLHKSKLGNPVRPAGIALVVVVIALGVVVNVLFSDTLVTRAAHTGLERANGATVDLESAGFSFTEGRLTLTGLAMADPNNLDTNLFSAELIEADLSTSDLLRKRWSLDRVAISGGRQGQQRAEPGQLTGPRPEPSQEPETSGDNEGTLEDYIENAQLWRQRLATARDWLDRLSGPADGEDEQPAASGEDGQPPPATETRDERIARVIRDRGYDAAIARHLIEESPRFLIRELAAAGVRSRYLENDLLDITAQYLSTNPSLAGQPPRIEVRSQSGDLVFDLTLAAAMGRSETNALELVYRGLPGDRVGEMLAVSGQPPVTGGTVDVAVDGAVSAVDSNLAMVVVLNGTTVTIPGAGSRQIDELSLPVDIRGPIDNPRITFNQQTLVSALGGAARQEAEQRVQEEVDELEQEAEDRVRDELEERGGDLLDRLGR